MRLDPFLTLVEESPLSTWLRESEFGFAGTFAVHIIGIGLLAAASVAINLRLLGFMPEVPLPAMRRYRPFFWAGVLIAIPSGMLLLIAYPTKTLTNPVFYFKIAAIVTALALTRAARDLWSREPAAGPLSARTRQFAGASLALWAAVIAAGRLLAYTYTRLLVSF
jgi:hypothetical protein